MKVGDLVVLSAYGKKREHNEVAYTGYGIIVDMDDETCVYTQIDINKYPIKIQWFNHKPRQPQPTQMWFHKRELKYFKKKVNK